jgi:hypothetical protein
VHQKVGQGGTIRLDAVFKDGAGNLVDPVTPLVDVLNPSDVAVVTDAAPVRAELGRYYYDYAVAAGAPLGVWTARWTATINSVAVEDDDTFEVVAAGDIVFDPADAKTQLQRMVAWDQDPQLTDPEVDDLLRLARAVDTDGRAVTDPEWVPTYDLNYAAAEGWRWKAGRVAALTSFSLEGQRVERSDMYDHCTKMADLYDGRVSGFVRLGAAAEE